MPASTPAIHFCDRILYLGQAPQVVSTVLAGGRVTLTDAAPLRDDVSTDEITPLPILTHFDEKLARYSYTGVKIAGVLPIGVDAVRASATAKALRASTAPRPRNSPASG